MSTEPPELASQPVHQGSFCWNEESCIQEKGRRGEKQNRIKLSVKGGGCSRTTYWSPLLPGNCSKSLLLLKRSYGNICFNISCADSPRQAKEHVLARTVSASRSVLMQKLEQLGQRQILHLLNVQELPARPGHGVQEGGRCVGDAFHTLMSGPTIYLCPMWSARSLSSPGR